MNLKSLSLIGLAFTLAVLGFSERPVYGSTIASNGKIAFVSGRDGNFEIYVMNSDGTGQTRLTTNQGNELAPAWSPDGLKIAFGSDRDGAYQIYVMNPDGTGVTRITNDSSNDVHPAWSPDGKQIVFMSDRDTGRFQIYAMNSDGTNVRRLTNDNNNDEMPAWSPDGTRIVFDDYTSLHMMSADGSNVTTLAQGIQGAWAPDGSKLVFVSSRDGNQEIYTMNSDGSNQVRLTNNTAADINPDWSPDSRKILFVSGRNGYDQVFVMVTDGSGAIPLTSDSAGDGSPSWQVVDGTPCPRTALYWKRNPSQWPVQSLLIGGKKYTRTQLVSILNRPLANDESLNLADQLIAAKLNVFAGSLSTPIHTTIVAADHVFHPFVGYLPYHVARTSPEGRAMVPLVPVLIKYNSRGLTPACIP